VMQFNNAGKELISGLSQVRAGLDTTMSSAGGFASVVSGKFYEVGVSGANMSVVLKSASDTIITVLKSASDTGSTALNALRDNGSAALNVLRDNGAAGLQALNDNGNAALGALRDNGSAALNALRDNGTAGLQTLLNNYTGVVNGWTAETNRLIQQVNAANAAIAGLQTVPATTTGSTTGGGGAGITGTMAEGGLASGSFFAGEQGIELVSTDTSLAVLNNQTTEALIAGMAAFGGGNSSQETNIYMTNNFYTNTPSQDLNSMGIASRALRGFN